MNENKIYARQLDIVKPSELDFPIMIIGAGGIGSWTTLALAKLGCQNISVCDFDKVEEKNTPSQIYNMKDVGKLKVEALAEKIKVDTEIVIKQYPINFRMIKELDPFPRVVICAVDSLEERRLIWGKLSKDHSIPIFDLYIDVRMAGDNVRILIASPFSDQSMTVYQKSMDSKVPVYEEPCTARSVVYNVFMCAGLVSNLVKKFAKGENAPFNINLDIKNVQFL